MRTTLILAVCLLGSSGARAQLAEGRITESEEVVLKKLYPKRHHFQLDLDGGLILNQSYVQTFLVRGAATYYLSEQWGVGLSLASGINSDKPERRCVETFYNDPDYEVDAQCEEQDGGDGLATAKTANVGPAYVPVRELQYVATVDAVWSPIYGKQIFLLGVTNHFDVQLTMGAGLAVSDYYAERTHIRGHEDRPSRGAFPEDASKGGGPGTSPGERDAEGELYGVEGRPDPERVTSPVLHLGLTQRWLFARRFSLRFELKNYTLIGTPGGFEPIFAVFTGLGVRF